MPEDSSKILFDRFEIKDTLKKDQHTTVYLAYHIYLGKKIILKTLSADELPDKTFIERFKREAKILAQLDHLNIIKVLDFGTSGNNFYISFEYFESRNLRKIIKENKLSDEEKNNLCIQLFHALNSAHQRGIIHRDIKPENILVNSKLELKIADFGLALVRDENILTQKTSIVGTPGYMSPEQIRGEELTPQTDLFSSGIVIYELFTGENPLIGKDISATINNILNLKIEKDFKQFSSLPVNIQKALEELLRKNFSKRTKTASEALEYFKTATKEKAVFEAKTPEKKSKKKYYWIAAVFVILIIGALIILNLNAFENNSVQTKQTIQIPPVISENDDSLKESDVVVSEENSNNLNDEQNVDITPKENPPEEKKELPAVASDGKLFVEVSPWADVFINNEKIGTTPFNDKIKLEPGSYKIKLVHPEFPDYSDSIQILQGEVKTIKINFYEEVGYLDCKIFPWGEIFINDVYKNTTPLRKPMVLMPGNYKIKIINPGYIKNIEEVVNIKAKETVVLKYNFDDLFNKQ